MYDDDDSQFNKIKVIVFPDSLYNVISKNTEWHFWQSRRSALSTRALIVNFEFLSGEKFMDVLPSYHQIYKDYHLTWLYINDVMQQKVISRSVKLFDDNSIIIWYFNETLPDKEFLEVYVSCSAIFKRESHSIVKELQLLHVWEMEI